MEESLHSSKQLNAHGIAVNLDSGKRSLWKLLSMPGVTREQIAQLDPRVDDLDPKIRTQLENDALYQQYLDRQRHDVEAMQKDENILIPEDFTYKGMPGLSAELAIKLQLRRPETLSQAGKIEGMTPAALALILAHLRKSKRSARQ